MLSLYARAVAALVLPLAWLAAACAQTPEERLARLFDDSWEFTLVEDPLFATHVGDARYNDRLPRETLADQQRRAAAERAFLERLAAIDRQALSRAAQVNYD